MASTKRPARLKLPATMDNLGKARDFVRDWGIALDFSAEDIADIVLAVDEAVTNVILHGYAGQSGSFELEIIEEIDALQIRLSDQAYAYDPRDTPEPDLTRPLEERPLGGMGVYLIRQIMDELHYEAPSAGGNRFTMIKKRHG